MTAPAEARTFEPHRHPYRWAVLAGVWLIYFSFGLLQSAMAPLVAPISADLRLSHTAMGSILGAWPLVYIFVAVPCGALIDRAGLKWSLLLAAGIMAASGVLRAVAFDHLTMFLAVALFGLGGPLISIGAPKAIAQWFQGPERGLAMGISITGSSLGVMLALALTNSVFMPWLEGDWHAVLLVYSGFIVAAGVVWLVLASHRAVRMAEPAGSGHASIAGQLDIFVELLRLRAVQLVLLMGTGIFFFYHGLANWLPEILRSGGMDATAAGLWASVPVAVGIIGALIIPRLATPPRRFAILLGLSVCITAGVLFLFIDTVSGLVAAVLFWGIARGSLMTITVLVLMETRGVDAGHIGAAGGLFFSAAEIGGVLGPLTLGIMSDATGGFDAGLWLLAGVGVTLMAILFVHRASEARGPASAE